MKRKSWFLTLLMSVVLISFFTAGSYKQDELYVRITKYTSATSAQFVPGEIIVKFKEGLSLATPLNVHKKFGTAVLENYKHFQRVSVPPGETVSSMAARYAALPEVEYAEPNYIAYATFTPNDPYYSYQWHFPNVSAPAGWDIWNTVSNKSSVKVAIIDTGVAYENYTGGGKTYYLAPDLAGTSFDAANAYDFVNNDAHANDDEGHGTHVSGTIAQTTNEGYGTAGLGFGLTVLPIKVLNASGSGTYANITKGVDWAVTKGANVINLSLTGPADDATLHAAVQRAANAGIVLCCATGNDSRGTIGYPARYAEAFAVGATTSGNARAKYSNYGNEMDVCAPGGDNRDRNKDGYMDGVLQQTFDKTAGYNSFGWYFYTGTSMATPHVAALCGMLKAKNPSWTRLNIENSVAGTATDLGTAGWDKYYGYGKINVQAALALTAPLSGYYPGSHGSAPIASKQAEPVKVAFGVGPNPFVGNTSVLFSSAVPGRVALRVYNVKGELVTTLVDETKSPGDYYLSWNGLDSRGRRMPAGTYYMKLDTPERSATKTVTLLR
ncbi:MAG: S8 family serine peptidase [Candidatus Eisenbacteria bacterium]|nr:S8 family serine peptidase [Candidatus Eisenbacteria bacterium]